MTVLPELPWACCSPCFLSSSFSYLTFFNSFFQKKKKRASLHSLQCVIWFVWVFPRLSWGSFPWGNKPSTSFWAPFISGSRNVSVCVLPCRTTWPWTTGKYWTSHCNKCQKYFLCCHYSLQLFWRHVLTNSSHKIQSLPQKNQQIWGQKTRKSRRPKNNENW